MPAGQSNTENEENKAQGSHSQSAGVSGIKKCSPSQPVYCRVTSKYQSDTTVNLQVYRSMEDSSRPINSPPVPALLIYCTIKRVIPLGAAATVNEVMLNSSPWILSINI